MATESIAAKIEQITKNITNFGLIRKINEIIGANNTLDTKIVSLDEAVAKINDDNLVHKANDETITGKKTFNADTTFNASINVKGYTTLEAPLTSIAPIRSDASLAVKEGSEYSFYAVPGSTSLNNSQFTTETVNLLGNTILTPATFTVKLDKSAAGEKTTIIDASKDSLIINTPRTLYNNDLISDNTTTLCNASIIVQPDGISSFDGKLILSKTQLDIGDTLYAGNSDLDIINKQGGSVNLYFSSGENDLAYIRYSPEQKALLICSGNENYAFKTVQDVNTSADDNTIVTAKWVNNKLSNFSTSDAANNLVHLNNDETITGTKTFSKEINAEAINLKYGQITYSDDYSTIYANFPKKSGNLINGTTFINGWFHSGPIESLGPITASGPVKANSFIDIYETDNNGAIDNTKGYTRLCPGWIYVIDHSVPGSKLQMSPTEILFNNTHLSKSGLYLSCYGEKSDGTKSSAIYNLDCDGCSLIDGKFSLDKNILKLGYDTTTKTSKVELGITTDNLLNVGNGSLITTATATNFNGQHTINKDNISLFNDIYSFRSNQALIFNGKYRFAETAINIANDSFTLSVDQHQFNYSDLLNYSDEQGLTIKTPSNSHWANLYLQPGGASGVVPEAFFRYQLGDAPDQDIIYIGGQNINNKWLPISYYNDIDNALDNNTLVTAKWTNQKIANYTVFTGASASTAGTKGFVPAPSAGDQSKFLRADGTWAIINTSGDSVSTTYVDTKIAEVVNSAPETLNTLNELATALGNDPNFATTISNQIGLKANKTDLKTVATSGSYNDLIDKPSILDNATQHTLNITYEDGTTETIKILGVIS